MLSITVTELLPEDKFETLAVVDPLGVQLYEYPGDPPAAVTVAPPVLVPHPVAEVEEIIAVRAEDG